MVACDVCGADAQGQAQRCDHPGQAAGGVVGPAPGAVGGHGGQLPSQVRGVTEGSRDRRQQDIGSS